MTGTSPHTLDHGNFVDPFALQNGPAKTGKEAHARVSCEDQRNFDASAFECDLEPVAQPFDQGRVFNEKLGVVSVHLSLTSDKSGLKRAGATKRVLEFTGSLAVLGVFHAQGVPDFTQPVAGNAGGLHPPKVCDKRSVDVAPKIESHSPWKGDFNAGVSRGIGFDIEVDFGQIEGQRDLAFIVRPFNVGRCCDPTGDFEHNRSTCFSCKADARFISILQWIKACLRFARHAGMPLSRVMGVISLMFVKEIRFLSRPTRTPSSVASPFARPGATLAGRAFSSPRPSATHSSRMPDRRPSVPHQRRGTLPHSCQKPDIKSLGVAMIVITLAAGLLNKIMSAASPLWRRTHSILAQSPAMNLGQSRQRQVRLSELKRTLRVVHRQAGRTPIRCDRNALQARCHVALIFITGSHFFSPSICPRTTCVGRGAFVHCNCMEAFQ